MRENVQGIRNINGRYKIDRRKLRIVWEMEKLKKLYVQLMDMNFAGECWWEGGCSIEGNKWEKKMGQW